MSRCDPDSGKVRAVACDAPFELRGGQVTPPTPANAEAYQQAWLRRGSEAILPEVRSSGLDRLWSKASGGELDPDGPTSRVRADLQSASFVSGAKDEVEEPDSNLHVRQVPTS